nr:hypothetical protein [Sphingomonadaceae bacterium]
PKANAQPEEAKRKTEPPPRRNRLDKSEAALSAAEERQVHSRAEFDARERALRDERRKMEAKERAQIERLISTRDKAASAYEDAMRDWRG